jgi:hypothetical protein
MIAHCIVTVQENLLQPSQQYFLQFFFKNTDVFTCLQENGDGGLRVLYAWMTVHNGATPRHMGQGVQVLILPVTRVRSAPKLLFGSCLDRSLSVMCDPYHKSA